MSAHTLVETLWRAWSSGEPLPSLCGGSTDGGSGGDGNPDPVVVVKEGGGPDDGGVKPGFDANSLVKTFLEKHGGDTGKAVNTLLDENAKLRAKNRELRDRVPQGATVLDAAATAKWVKYQALGEPEAVETSLTAAQALAAENARHKVAGTVRDAAALLKWNDKVLLKLVEAERRTVTIEERQEAGKLVREPFVTDAGDDKKKTPLAKAGELDWKDFLPALTGRAQDEPRRSTTPPGPPQGGVPHRPGENGQTTPAVPRPSLF